MKKQPLLIDGRKPSMQSLLLFLEGLEHTLITVMISAARIGMRAEELAERVKALESRRSPHYVPRKPGKAYERKRRK